MKPTRYKKWAVLALALASGFLASAQSNGVPGPADYGKFSSFITERNIFDPSRISHAPGIRPRFQPTRINRFAPAFTLVGTMSYEKGMFAFFDGNNFNLRKVLYQSDTNGIAGYLVSEITPTSVKLQTPDKKETVTMKIGEAMRQVGTHWLPAGRVQMSTDTGSTEIAAPAAADNAASPEASSAPSPALQGNETLRLLMLRRQQEK